MKRKKQMVAALLLAMLLALGTGCAAGPREAEPLPVTEEVPDQEAPAPEETPPAEEVPPAEEAAQPQPTENPTNEPAPQPETAPAGQQTPAPQPAAAPAAGTDELFSIQSKLTRAELWTQGSEKEELRSVTITDTAALEEIRQAINALEEQPGSGDAKVSDPWTAQLDLTLADGSQFCYGLRMAPDSQQLELDATIWVDASGQNRPAERTYYTAPGESFRALLDQLTQQGDPMVSLDPKGWMEQGMRFLLCDNQNRLAVWMEGNPFAGISQLEPVSEEQLGKKQEGWELRLTGEYTPLRYELYENGLKVTYHTGDVYTYRLTAQQRQQLDAACAKAWEGERVPSWLGLMSESKMEELILTQAGKSRSLGMDTQVYAALRQLTVSGPARTDTPMPDGVDQMEIRFNTGVQYTIGWQDGKLWVASSDMASQLCYTLTESRKKWLNNL